MRGVNLAGAEFGEDNLPGVYGRDYTYNSEATFRYFAAKGLNLIRLCLRWERLQPLLLGPLDAENLGIRGGKTSTGRGRTERRSSWTYTTSAATVVRSPRLPIWPTCGGACPPSSVTSQQFTVTGSCRPA